MKRGCAVGAMALALFASVALAAGHRSLKATRIATKQWTWVSSGVEWLPNTVDVQVDHDAVYWTTHGIHVVEMRKSEGRPHHLATLQSMTEWLALDDGFVYWNNAANGTIMRVPKVGGVASVVTKTSPGVCLGLTVSGPDLFWSTYLVKSTPMDGAIMQVAKEGGVSTILSRASRPTHVVADETWVYWTDAGNGTVSKVARSASLGAIVTLASKQEEPYGLAVDETSVYWSNRDGWSVLSVNKDGGAPRLIARDQPRPMAIIADKNSIYWVNEGTVAQSSDPAMPPEEDTIRNGSVMKAPKKGGAAVALAVGQNGPKGIAVDDLFVYWANARDGAVLKTRK